MAMFYLYLFFALAFTTSGQLLFRYYHTTNNKLYLGLTLLSFLLVPFFSYKSLVGLAIDTVYMATSLTIVFVLLGSVIFLKEKLTKYQIFGSIIIILGIIVYNL